MRTFFLLLLFSPLSAAPQLKIKKVAIEGAGIPIVMLNGGTSDMSVYAAHSKALAGRYKIIRMEQFNVQYATENKLLPENYSVKTESEAIKFTLDSLHIHEPIILIGHSYGGLIALDFALKHPKRIRSLILIEPPVFSLLHTYHVAVQDIDKMEKLLNEFTPQAEITTDMVKRFRCSLMNCDSIDIRKHPLWNIWLKQKNRLRGLAATVNYKANAKKITHFKKPVLIITGTETVPFHKMINEKLAEKFPFKETAFLKGGHTAINTNADEFIKVLQNFLQK